MKISIGESYPRIFKPVAYATKEIEGVGHSHIFITWKDRLNLRWVAEARGGGIQIISNKAFKSKNFVINVYDYECNEAQYKNAIEYIWAESDKSYGYLQMLGLLWMRAHIWWANIRGKKSKATNPLRDGEHSQICCEFAINTIVNALDIPSPDDVESYGLRETRVLNEKYGKKALEERIKRINR